MNVRIQTTEHSNPPEAMKTAISQLSAEVRELQEQLAQCAPRDPQPQQQQQYAGGYGDPYGAGAYGAPAAGYGGYQPAGGGEYGGGYQH